MRQTIGPLVLRARWRASVAAWESSGQEPEQLPVPIACGRSGQTSQGWRDRLEESLPVQARRA
jgi:hypothetical protein